MSTQQTQQTKRQSRHERATAATGLGRARSARRLCASSALGGRVHRR